MKVGNQQTVRAPTTTGKPEAAMTSELQGRLHETSNSRNSRDQQAAGSLATAEMPKHYIPTRAVTTVTARGRAIQEKSL